MIEKLVVIDSIPTSSNSPLSTVSQSTSTIVLSDSSGTEKEVEENQDDNKVGNQKKDGVVWINNDADTFPMFTFWDDGQNELKSKELRGAIRDYYKCAEKTCEARYHVTTKPDKSTFVTYYGKKHNHLPPNSPRILKKVKDKAVNLMRVGVTPAVDKG